ncbi:MAG: AIM24 family protein [Mycobacterium sp.]|uniref:AIM24 family protein n=1 Tax=Mycobacterium sp. TaxID=1785 RepID=UPI001ECC18D7|nr:AIM24 family protein [Mycobacterium sp.]MBW0016473.1 AIM24 family protein [Mycobacterium sp.]
MDAKITGTVMPVLEVSLSPGEILTAEAGELSWISESIQLRTSTRMAGSTGFLGGIKRAVGGGGLFMTEYSAVDRPGNVAFAAKLPGHIVPVHLRPDTPYLVHRHGFLCGVGDVQLSIAFQRKLGAGIFGGAGFVLQHLSGNGQAWIELSGETVAYTLGPGQTLRVHPGHVGMFDASVTFDITRVPGIKNMLFGGDGLFLATLTGPGRIWLQTLTVSNLAHAITPYLPQPSGESRGGGWVRTVGNLISD